MLLYLFYIESDIWLGEMNIILTLDLYGIDYL